METVLVLVLVYVVVLRTVFWCVFQVPVLLVGFSADRFIFKRSLFPCVLFEQNPSPEEPFVYVGEAFNRVLTGVGRRNLFKFSDGVER